MSKKEDCHFEWILEFDWETAAYEMDERKDYNESRLIATGFLGERLHVVCFTLRDNKKVARIISFRKANLREVKRYEKKKTTHQ